MLSLRLRAKSASDAPSPPGGPGLALREVGYRWFWLGLLGYTFAQEVQRFGLPWLMYEISGSKLLVGLAGFCLAIPNILFSPIGGVIADRGGRVRLIRITQTLSATLAIVFALGLFANVVGEWLALGFAVLVGTIAAVDQPARQAVLPLLVPRPVMMNAVALVNAAWNLARIAGPSLAGVLLALSLASGLGPGSLFLMPALGFGWMVFCMSRIHVQEGVAPRRTTSILHDLGEGFRFILGHRTARALILMLFTNGFFGLSTILLLPVFAEEVLGVDEGVLGLLAASSGIGALIGTMLIASLGGSTSRRGLLVLSASLFYGLALIAFANSTAVIVSGAFLMLAGALNSWYVTAANTLLQVLPPDAVRGRVMGVFALTFSMAPMGSALIGAIAEIWSTPVAMTIGGCVVVAVTGAILAREPELRRLN